MADAQNPPEGLTHFDESGASRMVPVGDKPATHRVAKAEATIRMQPETLQLIHQRDHAKGDVIEVARLAGIMAVKRTADLIPLCHPLAVEAVSVDIAPQGEDRIRIETHVELHGKTGVEMEALTAAATAALTVYDMCKAVDRAMTIESVRLLEKHGGRSGSFYAAEEKHKT